jgi:hypothetical protein
MSVVTQARVLQDGRSQTSPIASRMSTIDRYLTTCRMSSGKPAAVATISGSIGLRSGCRCLPSCRPLAALPIPATFGFGIGKQHRAVQTLEVALNRSRLRAASVVGQCFYQAIACTTAIAMSTVESKVQSMQTSREWEQDVNRTACAPPRSIARSCHRDLRRTWTGGSPFDIHTYTVLHSSDGHWMVCVIFRVPPGASTVLTVVINFDAPILLWVQH